MKQIELEAEKKIGEAGFVWTMNTNLGDGKMLQVTGNFAKGASAAQMSREIDVIAKVFQIQRLKLLELPTCEGALKTQADAGDNFTDQLEKMIEENRDKVKVPANIKAVMDNLRENIARTEANIQEGKRHYDSLLVTLKDLESE